MGDLELPQLYGTCDRPRYMGLYSPQLDVFAIQDLGSSATWDLGCLRYVKTMFHLSYIAFEGLSSLLVWSYTFLGDQAWCDTLRRLSLSNIIDWRLRMTHGADPDLWLDLDGQQSINILSKSSVKLRRHLPRGWRPQGVLSLWEESLVPVDAGDTSVGIGGGSVRLREPVGPALKNRANNKRTFSVQYWS